MKKSEKESASKGQMPPITFTAEAVRPYIIESYKALTNELTRARNKYGSRYDWRNRYERMKEAVGTAFSDDGADCYYRHYIDIKGKRSELPSTVRQAVVDLVEPAVRNCFLDLLRKENATGEPPLTEGEGGSGAATDDNAPKKKRTRKKKEGEG